MSDDNDNVIAFPQSTAFIDLEAIQRRALEFQALDFQTCDLTEIEHHMVALIRDRAELLAYLDRQTEINDLGDLPKLDGSKEFCRVPQIVLARLQSGALLAREHLIKQAAYYAALKQLSPDSPTIRQRAEDAYEAMQLARKAHGLPPLPKR
jgi:hypothetical protein